MEALALAVTLVVLAGIFLNIAALFHMRRYSGHDYERIGKSRSAQRGMHLFGLLLPGLAVVFGWYWLTVTKPKLESGVMTPPRLGSTGAQQAREELAFSVLRFRHPMPKSPRERPEVPPMDELRRPSTATSSESLVKRESTEMDLSEDDAREGFNFSDFRVLTDDEIQQAVGASRGSFAVTQELLTGLALSGLGKKSGRLSGLDGLEGVRHFLVGIAVGRALFSFWKSSSELLDVDNPSDLGSFLDASVADAKFFHELDSPSCSALLASLPSVVNEWLSGYASAISEPESMREQVLWLLASGVAYVGFQANRSTTGQ